MEKPTKPNTPLLECLSSREWCVLKAIANGKASKQIAEDLNISKNTVDTHRRNMIRKTGLCNTAQIVNWATKENWI